jgi:hypothetical protein
VVETARQQLTDHQSKAAEVEKEIEGKLDQVDQKVASSNKTHEELKQQIAQRGQILRENFEAALSESERELLKELDDSFNKMAVPMQKSRSCAENDLATVQALEQEKTALNKSSSTQLLNLSKTIASG